MHNDSPSSKTNLPYHGCRLGVFIRKGKLRLVRAVYTDVATHKQDTKDCFLLPWLDVDRLTGSIRKPVAEVTFRIPVYICVFVLCGETNKNLLMAYESNPLLLGSDSDW